MGVVYLPTWIAEFYGKNTGPNIVVKQLWYTHENKVCPLKGPFQK